MKTTSSFTLIELLVVIAIIGLISSIVLVNLGSPKEKTRIAKSLEFSQSLNNVLGSEAVGIWNFDEGSDGATLSSAKDSSSYGNNGSCSGATCPTYTSDTPQNMVGTGAGRYALSFDGVNDKITVLDNNSLDLDDSFSVEMWIKCNPPSANYPYLIYKAGGGMYNYRFYLTTNGKVTWHYKDNLGNDIYLTSTWSVCNNNWNHLVGVRETSTTKMKLYINGVLNNNKTDTTTGTFKNTGDVILGAGSAYYLGFIDEVRIYGQALISTQIQKHYAEGLERHQNLVVK